MKHALFSVDGVPAGATREAVVDGVDIVVIHTHDSEIYALRNRCPHRGARLSLGQVQPLTIGGDVGDRRLAEDGYVLRCPWHQYEFDVVTGKCIADERLRVRSYVTYVESGMVCVER